MAAAYERYRHDPEFDTGGLETELVGILGDAGFQLTEGDIDKIVVPLNEVIEAGGPVEMAYLALSRINGRSPRTLRTDIAVAPEEPAGFPEPLRPSPSNRERVEWVAQLLEAQRPGR